MPDSATIPLHRTPDRPASLEAAALLTKHLSKLQQRVLLAIRLAPKAITALELEEQYEFTALAPSTVRKRVSELQSLGLIDGVGVQSYTDSRGRTSRGEAFVVAEVSHG